MSIMMYLGFQARVLNFVNVKCIISTKVSKTKKSYRYILSKSVCGPCLTTYSGVDMYSLSNNVYVLYS